MAKLYFDKNGAGLGTKPAFDCACALVGHVDHLVYGSDYFKDAGQSVHALDKRVSGDGCLCLRTTRPRFMYKNAKTLLSSHQA